MQPAQKRQRLEEEGEQSQDPATAELLQRIRELEEEHAPARAQEELRLRLPAQELQCLVCEHKARWCSSGAVQWLQTSRDLSAGARGAISWLVALSLRQRSFLRGRH